MPYRRAFMVSWKLRCITSPRLFPSLAPAPAYSEDAEEFVLWSEDGIMAATELGNPEKCYYGKFYNAQVAKG